MRILLDECLPRRLAAAIEGHDVRTVQQAGWAGLKNGALLRKIDGAFDVFVTVDKNMPAQNSLSGSAFGVMILRARSNRFDELNPLVPAILSKLETLGPGQIAFVEAPAQ
jgi:predicted nuclease of predicted toxin-antitoxin system